MMEAMKCWRCFLKSSSTGKYHDTETVERSYKGTVFGKRPEARDNTYANDSGSAAQFFYSSKAGLLDRIGIKSSNREKRFFNPVACQVDYAPKRDGARHVRRDRYDWSGRDA